MTDRPKNPKLSNDDLKAIALSEYCESAGRPIPVTELKAAHRILHEDDAPTSEPLGVWFLENFIGPFLKWSLILYGGLFAVLILAALLSRCSS